MKLLRLEILNLASLDKKGGEVIDFEKGPLGSSNIFSIVGPTGSGKSTILDAICLALYNRAPRYPRKMNDKGRIKIYGIMDDDESNRLAPTDGRNILSRGKKQGYSKLTFLANDGVVYRAEWHVSFSRTRYKDVITCLYELTFEDGVLRREEARDWSSLPQIIGLDYDQFLRTVLIAQGSFANFLTASENERYELLEKLIGCEELYKGIAEEIKAQKSAADASLMEVNSQLAAYESAILDSQKLKELEETIARLEQEEAEVKKKTEYVNKALAWYEEERKHVLAIFRFEEALKKAQEGVNAAAERLGRLALHDAAEEAIGYYGDQAGADAQIADISKKLAELEKQASDCNEKMTAQTQALADLKAKATEAQKALDAQKPRIAAARTLMGEVNSAYAAANEKYKACKESGVIPTGNEDPQAVEAEKAQALAAYASAKDAFDALDSTALQQAKSAADAVVDDVKDAIKVSHDLAANATESADLRAKAAVEQERVKQIDEELPKVNVEALRSELQTLNNTRTLIKSESLETLRGQLKDGEACPLCGAVRHPYEAHVAFQSVTGELDALIAAKTEEYDAKVKVQKALGEERVSLVTAISAQGTRLAQLQTADADLRTRWASISAAHPDWPCDEAALNALLPNLMALAQAADKAMSDYLTRQGQVEALRIAKEKAVVLSEYVVLRAAYNAKKAAIREQIGDNDPDKFETQLTKAVTDAAEAVAAGEESLGKLREGLEGIKGKQVQLIEQNTAEQVKSQRCGNALAGWLDAYNATAERALAVEDIAALHGAQDNWNALRIERDQLNGAVREASSLLDNERKALDAISASQPNETMDVLNARKGILEAYSSKALVEAQAAKSNHDSAVAAVGGLAQQKADAQTLADEWQEIAKAIGGDGKTLRKIAQCYTLRFLVEHANHEIRRFSSRYELQQVKNSLAIRVIDHYRADDVRDTTSLSGGETFIVSLGLALGLSSLSSRSISFDNLFIDEGFGTLDPDTLAVVIDSLAMLQSSQGKKVGVISHTDTMSERITTQIRIVKDGSSGSSHIEVV